MLRVLTEKMRIGVRKDVYPMVEIDCADLIPRVPRQPRMPRRIDIASPHALAYLETRGYPYVAVCMNTIR